MFGLDAVRQALVGQSALVFGSAPDPVLPPEEVMRESRLICVNGSARTAAALGLPSPHMIVMSDVVFDARRPVNIEAINALKGIHTMHLVVQADRFRKQRLAEMAESIGLSYDNLHVIPPRVRKYMLWRVTRDLRYLLPGKVREIRISTGMSACAIAFYANAVSCMTSGISFTKHGHSYSKRGERRRHIESDQWFVNRVRALGHELQMLG